MALDKDEKATPVSQTSTMKWMEEYSIYDEENAQFTRFFDAAELPDLSGAVDTEISVTINDPHERMDRMADKYLGDVRLWWVIAAYNGFDSPEDNLYLGLEVKIPDRQWVQDNVITLPRIQRKTI